MPLVPPSSRSGGGTVNSVSAGDASVAVAGTAADPTVSVAAGGVTVAKMSSGAAAAGTLATADGAGGVSYAAGLSRYTATFDGVNTAAEFNLLSQSIPGGAIGATGGLLILVTAGYTNNTGANRTLTLRIALGGTNLWQATSINIGGSAVVRTFTLSAFLANEGSASAQRLAGRVAISTATAATVGVGVFDTSLNAEQAMALPSGTSAVNTAAAQTLVVAATHSLASASLELKGTIAVVVIP